MEVTINLDGDGAFVDLADRIRQAGRLMRIATLDHGMDSGKPSVVLAIELENRTVLTVETSVRIFQLAAAAMFGKYGDVTGAGADVLIHDSRGASGSATVILKDESRE